MLWPLRRSPRNGLHLRRCEDLPGARQGPALSNHLQRGQDSMASTKEAAGVNGFRFHDFRHDHATKLLRESRNLKLVQKALNHRNIKTTLRYAHVLDEEIAEAMERVAKSRKTFRSSERKAS